MTGDDCSDGSASQTPEEETPKPAPRAAKATPAAIIVALVIATIVGLSLWYLVQPQPLIIQGEAESTRIDQAARVDGRVARIPVSRGQDIATGKALLEIDNPELLAKLQEAKAAKAVAEADLARINAGTRQEVVAVRKAEIDRAEANMVLARQNYDRTRQLAGDKFASQAKLDEATDTLQLAQRSYDQAKLAHAEAVAGYTREEREMAEAKVKKAEASIATLQALVDQLVVSAPIAAQIYQINVEPGEVVVPGVPLLSLVDLDDVWLRFDLREDLLQGLKVGDQFAARLPALDDREVRLTVKLIAAKGEYAGWRATRATGDFDLRTFQIRAYPVEKIPGLRPGMSAYADWRAGRGR